MTTSIVKPDTASIIADISSGGAAPTVDVMIGIGLQKDSEAVFFQYQGDERPSSQRSNQEAASTQSIWTQAWHDWCMGPRSRIGPSRMLTASLVAQSPSRASGFESLARRPQMVRTVHKADMSDSVCVSTRAVTIW